MFALGSKKQDSRDEFYIKLLDFYKNFLKRTSDSVRELSEMQKNYKEFYDEFKEFQKDPSVLMELTKDANSEIGALVMVQLARIAILQSKMTHLYELDAKQQETLSTELTTFINEFSENIGKLKKLKEKQ